MSEYSNAKIEVYGGWREIGGNCIVVRDGDRKVVFDNGIRFRELKRFYSGRVEPLGVAELRDLGIIPGLEVYSGAEALYISHMHMDHVGLLSAVPSDLEVVLPSVRVAEDTLFTWYKGSTTWLAYLPPSYSVKLTDRGYLSEDGYGVVSIPVSHSAYPANSFLYIGKNLTLFYSGDLRLDFLTALNFQDLREVPRKLGIDGIDVALIEGTNFSMELEHFPITPQVFRESLTYALSTYDLVAVSIDPLDLEAFTLILDSAPMFGKQVVISSKRLLWAVDYLKKVMGRQVENICVALEVGLIPQTYVDIIELSEVFKRRKDYIIVIEPVAFLEILRKLKLWSEERRFTNSAVILMDPEPKETVKEVEEGVIARWLNIFGFEVYRLRISGHYLPHQLSELVGVFKPKAFIPIHTENPSLMMSVYRESMERLNPSNPPPLLTS
ncbi:MAG: hypothetical protein QXZ63_02515 [Sulfolobales archaeon]